LDDQLGRMAFDIYYSVKRKAYLIKPLGVE
jgi:hypothetical protein